MRFFAQLGILLKKNWILSKRNFRGTLIMFLSPIFFCLLLYILKVGTESDVNQKELVQQYLEFQRSPISPLIPRCTNRRGTSNCLSLGLVTERAVLESPLSNPKFNATYEVTTSNFNATDQAAFQSVIDQLMDDQGMKLRSAEDAADGEAFLFSTRETMDDFMLAKKNNTQVGIILTLQDDASVVTGPWPGRKMLYTVQLNSTIMYRYGVAIRPEIVVGAPTALAIATAIARVVSGNPTLAVDLEAAKMPRPELIPSDIVKGAGPIFFFGALMFNVVIQLGQIVYEKERKLREGMKVMGLADAPYWLSWLITNMAINFISVWFLIIGGFIFQFDFFKNNSFGAYYFLFLLFAWSMVPFTFLISILTDKSRTAFSLGFFMFILGFFAISFAPLVFGEDFLKGKFRNLSILFRLIPFMLLSKGMDDIGSFSSNIDSGFAWSMRFDNAYWSLNKTYGWLIADFFILGGLAIYFDNVVKGQFGRSKPLWYFLLPSYWMGAPKVAGPPKPIPPAIEERIFRDKEVRVIGPDGNQARMIVPIRVTDEEVNSEVQAIEAGQKRPGQDPNMAICIMGLNRTFQSTVPCTAGLVKSGEPFFAVRKLSLSIEKDKLFCLLGHNGAGKSTLINMMTGLIDPTYGDANVLGYSVRDQMPQIRSVMGVCPQHDILWDQLTGREHLEIYARLKGISHEEVLREVDERLHDVHLVSAADVQSGAYSGGMKRRLSTAIAFIADPKIVFLDEPTTGMDPVSRRQVWNMIERKKPGRAIILTTHSMEEADILSDRIGIMGEGRLITLGSSLRLKSKFGSGYQVTIVLADPSKTLEVVRYVKENLNGLEPAPNHPVGILPYVIPRFMLDSLQNLFSRLEHKSGSLAIKDVQIGMTSLEQVFISVSNMGDHGIPPPGQGMEMAPMNSHHHH